MPFHDGRHGSPVFDEIMSNMALIFSEGWSRYFSDSYFLTMSTVSLKPMRHLGP